VKSIEGLLVRRGSLEGSNHYDWMQGRHRLLDLAGLSPPVPAQQRRRDGEVVETLEEVYRHASRALPELEEILRACTEGVDGMEVKIAPLKPRQRAIEKAKDDDACVRDLVPFAAVIVSGSASSDANLASTEDYSARAPPAVSYLLDICRARVCTDKGQVLKVVEQLTGKAGIKVVRIQNRFASPLWNTFQDVLMNVELPGGHIAEVQVVLGTSRQDSMELYQCE
jgi:hypothetical protein